MITSPKLEEAITAAAKSSPSAIVVDLSAGGVSGLGRDGCPGRRARSNSPGAVKLVVVADGPATSRPLKLVGIADVVDLYATLDEALAALRDMKTPRQRGSQQVDMTDARRVQRAFREDRRRRRTRTRGPDPARTRPAGCASISCSDRREGQRCAAGGLRGAGQRGRVRLRGCPAAARARCMCAPPTTATRRVLTVTVSR